MANAQSEIHRMYIPLHCSPLIKKRRGRNQSRDTSETL